MTHPIGLIDTNVVVLWGAVNADELPERVTISSITLAELSIGPMITSSPSQMAKRLSILQWAESAFDPIPFDSDAAREYGAVWAATRPAGRDPRRRIADLLIACIAISHRVPLYTVNPKDFRGLEHLLTIEAVTHPDKN
ncbi:hypothetical protein HNR23_005316 [Nocardiopsis mwathae]|uniref:PIN domain-containing protein n=1 Tax=Nocardiopsis mwathae TaxID=1472723 RepID=A0A7X0D9K9_9ACTN|nr:type II toxin-antitoxin system VapC family toxin [Nocardiopsis mwathae]MBB6175174.1 hypothetical protein [Nocardiopsis mwathae]